MKDLDRHTIREFLSELGSEKPAPGGGSASALAAALGVSLLEMTAQINTRRHSKSGPDEPQAAVRIAEALKIRQRLTEIITLDALAFEEITKSASDRQSPAYKEALKHGAAVPLEICELCARALALCVEERPRTSKWLESDLFEASIILEAAIRSARLNVEINLKELGADPFVAQTVSRLDQLQKGAAEVLAALRSVK